VNETYKSAGVDIQAGDETVKKIKILAKSTFNKNVLSDIGLFGAFYQADFPFYKEPVLVSSVDGVGTKLKIAILMNQHDTVGQDLVNHCVNDIAVCGAKPLFFLDYLAFGKLDPKIAELIIKGFATACKENDCALIGGETAEMPGMYAEDDYDMSGTIVGIVEKSEIIKGKEICEGDILLGFPSSGLHTNGYSLARKVLFNRYTIHDRHPLIKGMIGEELLRVHKSYLKLISKLISKFKIKGFSHITGGGIVGNTMRIVPQGLKLNINWEAWEWLPIFKLIQQTGQIDVEEMREVFNLGIGLIAVVSKNDADSILDYCKSINEKVYIIGAVN
jgi:phosphoribosylformylglycinamidine cyclo-ligase